MSHTVTKATLLLSVCTSFWNSHFENWHLLFEIAELSLFKKHYSEKNYLSCLSFLLQILLVETHSKRLIRLRLHQKISSRRPQRWIPSPHQTPSVKVPHYLPRYLLKARRWNFNVNNYIKSQECRFLNDGLLLGYHCTAYYILCG